MQDLVESDASILNWSPHVFQSIAGRGLIDRAFDVLVQTIDEVLGLVNVESNVVVGNSNFGVDESHIGGVTSDRIEDDLLILEVVRPSVGERLVAVSGQAVGGSHGRV